MRTPAKKAYAGTALLILFSLALLVVFLVLPAKDIIFGSHRWSLERPGFQQGLLELAGYILGIGFLSVVLSNKMRILRPLLIVAGASFYLLSHRAFVPVLVAYLYLECIYQIGGQVENCLEKKRSRLFIRKNAPSGEPFDAKPGLTATSVIAGILQRFIYGFVVWSFFAILISLLGYGTPHHLRILTVVLFLLSMLLSLFLGHTDWMPLYFIKKLQKINKIQTLLVVVAIFLLCAQAIKGMFAADYDSVWYGLNTEYTLFGASGMFENLGLLQFVYYYSKLFELFCGPFADLNMFSLIYGVNIIFLVLISLTCIYICMRTTKNTTFSLVFMLLVTSSPIVCNMATTAKTNISSTFFLLATALWFVEFFTSPNHKYLLNALICVLMTACLKVHGFLFLLGLAASVILCIIYFVRKNNCKQLYLPLKKQWPGSLALLLMSGSIVWGIHYRTYTLTGIPLYPFLRNVQQALGFRMKYPFNYIVADSLDANANVFERVSLGEHIYSLLFDPANTVDYMNISIYYATWPGIAFVFLGLFTVAALIFFGIKYKGLVKSIFADKIMKYFTIISLPTIVIGAIYAVFFFHVGFNGDYYIFPVTVATVFFGVVLTKLFSALLVSNQKAGQKNTTARMRTDGRILKYFVIFAVLALWLLQTVCTMLFHWSWVIGVDEFKFNPLVNPIKTSYEYDAFNDGQSTWIGLFGYQDLYEFILENSREEHMRVLGTVDNQYYRRLPWRYEDGYRSQGEMAGVFQNRDTLITYLKWAKIDWILVPNNMDEALHTPLLYETALYFKDDLHCPTHMFEHCMLVNISEYTQQEEGN